MFASQHISVTSLCRLLREAIAREDKLVLEVEKLKAQLDQIGEQYRLSSVCRDLKLENEKLKAQLDEKETFIQRVITWPHDADPFCSPDHDNDETTYQQ